MLSAMTLRLVILLLTLIQSERFYHNLPFLHLDTRLSEIAQCRVDDMVDRSYFSHYTPEGAMVFDHFTATERQSCYIGEVLARNNASSPAETALSSLMASLSHREVLLRSEYREIGIGVGQDADGVTYYVVILRGCLLQQ